jgi:hypothetical protein
VAYGIALLVLGGLTWSTDAVSGAVGLISGAGFMFIGRRTQRRLRRNPQEILANFAALEERDRQLPLWRHALDWLTLLLVGAAVAAWMMASTLAAGYGPGLTVAWSVVAVLFFATSIAMLAWSLSRYRRSRRVC